jgi:hypothetical protein
MEEGSLMMGQIAGMISNVLPVKALFEQMAAEASERIREMSVNLLENGLAVGIASCEE